MLAIVLLQHGRWRDTIACLQSLAPAIDAGLARVIVVDNASTDDSVAHLEHWMRGAHVATPRPVHDTVATQWWPLTGTDSTWDIRVPSPNPPGEPAAWTLFLAPENCGFAVGMNHGLRTALSDGRVDAVWLLNNDTVVAEGAVAAIRQALDASPTNVGQFGTTVCYYDRPTIVQSVGWCHWNAWFATTRRIHDGASIAQPLTRETHQPGYVYGASWVLRSRALHDVGLLSEEGFLYGEELDWSRRATPRWQSGLIEAAVVWHREGATIGAGVASAAARSELADLCGIAARLRLTRRFFPKRLPIVYLSLFGAALNRLWRGNPRRAKAVANLVLSGGLPSPRPVPSAASQSSSTS